MIFPGMDPYLEDPQLWPGVHARLIVYACDFLQPLLVPRYLAAIEERVYLQGPETDRTPDVWVRRQKKKKSHTKDATASVGVMEMDEPVVVTTAPDEVHETYVTILDRYEKQKLVAVIEIVSPTNKYAGPGRDSYRAKQQSVLQSDAHLVEIDLLRTGPHVLAVDERLAREYEPYDYLACVNRAERPRHRFELYPRTVRQRLPRLRIPLTGDDPDVPLDLQAVLERTYEQARYGDRLAYDRPCRPPLAQPDQAWADGLIHQARPRSTKANTNPAKRGNKKP